MRCYGIRSRTVQVYNFILVAHAGLFVGVLIFHLIRCWAMRPGNVARVFRTASDFDKTVFPTGLPVLTLLLRAFFFRDVTDQWGTEYECIVQERKELQREARSLRKQAEKLFREDSMMEAAEAKIASKMTKQKMDEAEFVDLWCTTLEESFGKGEHPPMQDSLREVQRVLAEANLQAPNFDIGEL